MVIRFLCPNGHKIHCETDRAGKPAKCPKCGVKFLVPGPAELEQMRWGTMPSGEADAGDGEAERPGAAPGQEEQIEFFCPNGHPLHGPRSMQGLPGQCPECGVQFRIPSEGQAASTEESHAELGPPFIPTGDRRTPNHASEATAVAPREASQLVAPAGAPEAPHPAEIPRAVPVDHDPTLPRPGSIHPLAGLFSRLWAERPRGAVIELHLADGTTIAPERYAPDLSQGSVGVFASTSSDGMQAVIAVAWDRVARVVVRGIEQLPHEFRD